MRVEMLCGQRTGVAYPAACGMGTGTILIHQIPQADLVAARQIGFQAVSELINLDEGTGYEFLECDEN